VLRLARRGWWAIVLAAVIGAAFAAILGSRADSVYESETRMLIGPPGERVSQLRAAGQRAQTYAELATSRPVLEATRRRLGLRTSLTDLAADVRSQADDVTRLLTITARASSARGAARLASVIPDELTRVAFGGRPPPPNELRIVEPAQTPSASLGASRLPMILIAALTGALVALTLLLLADAVRGRVRGPLELAEATEAPFLGAMDGPAGDRLVAVRLRLAGAGPSLRSIVVAGLDGEGGGEAAVRLAMALAGDGARTILIDGQAGAAEATAYLGLDGRAGVAQLLEPSPPRLEDVVVRHESGIDVIPAGAAEHDPGEDGLRALLRRLAGDVDVVVVSAGSHEPSPAGLRWARAASGVLLVARQDHALRDAATLAADAFRQVGARVLGAVLAEPAAGRPQADVLAGNAAAGNAPRGRRRRPQTDRPRPDVAGAVSVQVPGKGPTGLSGGS
jgi:Mrp family chromosome partitioning ATPase